MLLEKLHRRTRRPVGCGAVALACVLCTPSPASGLPAKTPTVSLAGVSLGMRKKDVRRILGAPAKVRRYQLEPEAPDCNIWTYRRSLTVDFCYDHFYVKPSDPQGVVNIATQSRIDVFKNGVHVGSPAWAVRRFHPQYCYLPGADESTKGWRPNFGLCTWYPRAGSAPVSVACYPIIDFEFASRRIYRIVVWFSAAVFGCHNFKDLHGPPVTLPD
jgi:hypothetical protein